MKFETRINENNQVMIPTDYIKKYNLESEDIVEWEENENGEIVVSFRKKAY